MNETINSFTQLDAWRESHKCVPDIYKIVKTFLSDEMYGLVSQMRRASVSITSSVAAGFSRSTYADKAYLNATFHGSLTKIQNQLLIAKDVNYNTNAEFEKIVIQAVIAHKLISGLIKATKLRIKKFMIHNSCFIIHYPEASV